MQLKLRVLAGSHTGKEIHVRGERLLIGRAEECQLRPNSEKISRHHCEIAVEGGKSVVRDLNSRNGTFVNGKAISKAIELNHGDRLAVGPLQFEVLLLTDLKGEKKPKVRSIKEAAARTASQSAADESDVESWLTAFTGDADEDTAVLDRREVTAAAEQNVKKFVIPGSDQPKKSEEDEQDAGPAKDSGDTRSAASEAIRRFLSGS